MGISMLSLDIWDTVLRRRCHPDESKYGLARYVLLKYHLSLKSEYKKALPSTLVRIRWECEHSIANRNKNNGWDDEYPIHEVISLWIHLIMSELSDKELDILLEEFIRFELEHEMYISYLDPEICEKVSKMRYDKLVYISDFYMQKKHIDKLLEQYEDQIKFDGGMVSSDHNYNKKSGRLFTELQKSFQTFSNKHIHIGDNPTSDVKSAKRLGIQALRYLPLNGHIQRTKHRINYIVRSRFKNSKNLYGYFKDVRKQLKDIRTEDTYVNLGIQHSFYFVMYIIGIIEAAIREGVDKVYYFTREGEFFKQIHDAIDEAGVFGFSIPKAELLEVSRMATFAPSIQEISINGMMRLWAQYPNQSVDAFFKSLNIKIEEYSSFLLKYGLVDFHEPLFEIYNQESMINLFLDQEFIKKLTVDILEKRKIFINYLNHKGINKEAEKIFVVDIGWRGSIQDNISLLFPSTEFIGFYMGVFRPYYPQIPNSRKIGFVKSNEDGNYVWYLRHPYPLEMYTNSGNGSVVGYRETQDGQVEPIRHNYEKEDIIYHKYTRLFQKGVLLSIPIHGQMIRTYSFLTDELRYYTMKSLKKFMVNPNKILIKPFFEMVDNNIFGIGKLEAMPLKISKSMLSKAFVSINGLKTLIQNVEESHWPHGVLKMYHLGVGHWIYNKFAQKMYKDYSSIVPLKYSHKVKLSLKSYQLVDLNMYYIKDKSIINSVCYVICGFISAIDEFREGYKIFVQITDNEKILHFDTKQLIVSNKKIYFSAKIASSVFDEKRSQVDITIVNDQKLIYSIVANNT